jgi:hypothetical protein
MLLIPRRGISSAATSRLCWLAEDATLESWDIPRAADDSNSADGTGCIPLYPSPHDMDKALYAPYSDPSHGDDLTNTNNFRYLFQNGRGKLITSTQKTSAFITLQGTNCTAFGIAESNLHWNFQHQGQYKSLIQNHWTNSQSVFSSCPINPSTSSQPDHLPGVACQSLKGAYGGQIVSHGANHIGC